MTNLRLVLLAAATMSMSVLGISAQTAETPGQPQSHTIAVMPGFGPAGSTVADKPHAPFSGVLVQHWEQTLSDGVNITRDVKEVVMRDSMGRIYRAREIKSSAARETEPKRMITISDPVEHVQYVCSPVKICRQMQYQPLPHANRARVSNPKKMPDINVEDLGTSNFNGMEVEGTRVTRLIREGMIGNDRPFTSVEELWRSQELGLDVKVTRNDPRAGTRTTELTDLQLGEPDAKYFQIPEGYKVVEGHNGPLGAMSPLQSESDYAYPAPPMPPGTLPPNQ